MKIGLDISQIVYEGTGVATYTRSLVEGLSRVTKDNQFVLFGSSLRKRRILKEFAQNFDKKIFKGKFYHLPPKLLEFLWNGIHLAPIENFIGDVDIFHSSDWLEPPTKNAKRISTIHDLTVYKYPEAFSSRGGHNIVANQKRRLFFVKNYSDLIIAVSETTKKDAVEILKIPEEKIRVIYEAAEPIFSPKSTEKITEIKERFGIRGEYLLCVGTREPRKNLDRVIMAYTEIVEDFPDLSLVVAGKYGWGDDSSKFKVQSAKLTRERVKILGFVEKEDLATLYSGARAFVYPSLYEGFGLPILEAMACGVPVITSNVGSMKEIAAGNTFLVDPESVRSIAEKMTIICQSSELAEEYRIKSLKRAGEFSWDKTALQTLEVYRSLLD